jgi:hypothetical protein
MTERATISQVVQIGAESVQGTAVAAGKLLGALELSGGIKAENKAFRPTGHKYSSFVVPGKEWVEMKLSGQATYGEIVYPLCSILKNVSPTADGTLPKLWTFTPALSTEDTVKTYTIEQGSTVRAHSFAYGLVTEFGLKFTRDGCEVSGTMIGQRISDGITLTSTPAAIEDPYMPIAGTQIDVKLADSWAGLAGASVFARMLQAEWKISDRFKPMWVLDSSKTSWVAHVESPPKVELKLLVEADAAGMALLTLMRAGTGKWVRIACTGAAIESGKYWSLQIDGSYNVLAAAEWKDEDGVYAIEWTLEAVYDATAVKTIEVIARNKVASL